jgi:hypothetical protein
MNAPLFIFSDDFGELVLLRLLLYKQPVHAFLALPQRLFKYVEFPNVTKFLYRNAADLKKYVEEVKPEQVIIFSAYLIAPNGLLTYPEFYSFLDYLDQKNIEVSTSDPFMRYYDKLEFEPGPVNFISGIRNKFKEISERLVPYRHLYAVPVQFETAPHQSFSNPFKLDASGQPDKSRQWTFIMSAVDSMILLRDNDGTYPDTLIPLFTSLVKDYGIKVNLVFPDFMYNTLKSKLAGLPDINYVAYCSLDLFEEMVARSELMVYWNLFSASTLLCRLYNKPTVFLGKGHMETIFPGFFNYIRSSWFPYNDPEIMQIDEAFIPSLINRLKAGEGVTKDPALYQPYYELDSPLAVLSRKTEAV